MQEGLEQEGFPEAMAGLIAHLKAWSPGLLVTIAPYYLVWGPYKQLLQVGGWCTRVHLLQQRG